jgi:hypothetical protein
MNVRQQLYKKNRLSGMNAYRSAIKAGYSHNTAIAAHRNIEKRIKFNDLLLKHGLDDHTVIQVLGDGLNANRSMARDKAFTDDDGKTQKITELVEVPDHSTRHKFLDTFLKIRGDLKDGPLIDNSKHTHFTVVLDGNGTEADQHQLTA